MAESLNHHDQFPQTTKEVKDFLRLCLQQPLIPLPKDTANFAAATNYSLEPFTVRTINSVNSVLPPLRHLAATATVAHALSSLVERGVTSPHTIEMVSPVHLFSFANNTNKSSLDQATVIASHLHALTCEFLTTFFPRFKDSTIPLPILTFDNPQAIENLIVLARQLLPQLPPEIFAQIGTMAEKYSNGLSPQERALRSLVYLLSHKDFYGHADHLGIFPVDSDLLLVLPRSEQPFIDILPALADDNLNGSSRQSITTFMAPIRRAHYLFGQRATMGGEVVLRGEPNLVGVAKKAQFWPSQKRVNGISIPPDHRAELFLAAMILDQTMSGGKPTLVNNNRLSLQRLILKHLDPKSLSAFDQPAHADSGGWGYA